MYLHPVWGDALTLWVCATDLHMSPDAVHRTPARTIDRMLAINRKANEVAGEPRS